MAAVLAGCAAPVAGTQADAAVPPGTDVFRSRPAAADCHRVDLSALGQFSLVTVPAGKAESKKVDARQDHVWASCVGRTPQTVATDGSVTGGDPVWVLSFATSAAATSDSQRQSTTDHAPGYRTLVRAARLGDARAEVLMDVHADDHATLVVVTVFDPGTGRPAARCGLAATRGDRADAAVDWCLKGLADQLLRPPGSLGPLPAAVASPSATASGGADVGPSGSPSPTPSAVVPSAGATPSAAVPSPSPTPSAALPSGSPAT